MSNDETFAPLTRLYVARWPGGRAMIISADSMTEVAARLDEVGDPGTCEVTPLDHPVALVLRPRGLPVGGSLHEVSLDALEDALEVQQAINRAAFPHLHALIEASSDAGEPDIDLAAWGDAVTREMERTLAPSAEWAHAVAVWWEEMTGARSDRTAAAREHMGVTIPGEPQPASAARVHFEAEHRRIRERVDAALGLDETHPRAKQPVKKSPKSAKPASTAARKGKPPRGGNPGRSRR